MTARVRREPNANQPDRCPSIDPHGTLQCGRLIHQDNHCSFGGVAWRKGDAHLGPSAAALIAAADAWRDEGRAVMFNRAAGDLTPQQRVEQWLRKRAEQATR